MACFLEAASTDVWRVTVEGYTPPGDPLFPTAEEDPLVKANAKAKNLLYGAMTKGSSIEFAHVLPPMIFGLF